MCDLLIDTKCYGLTYQIVNNVDILTVREPKLDKSFPKSQFLIPSYNTPYRYDRNLAGGEITAQKITYFTAQK